MLLAFIDEIKTAGISEEKGIIVPFALKHGLDISAGVYDKVRAAKKDKFLVGMCGVYPLKIAFIYIYREIG